MKVNAKLYAHKARIYKMKQCIDNCRKFNLPNVNSTIHFICNECNGSVYAKSKKKIT